MDKANVTMTAVDPTLQRKSGWVKRVTSSAFVRGVAVLSSGQALAAALQILAAPILGRLYRPEEYGVLGTYMAVAAVFMSIGNWQYSQGIVVEGRDKSAYLLVRLCMLTSGFTTIVSAVIALGIFLYSSEGFHSEQAWFLLLPVSTMLGGVTMAWAALANRQKKYRMMAMIQVASMSLGILVSLGFGFAGHGYLGLFYAYFCALITRALLFAWFYFRLPERKDHHISRPRLRVMARKHRNFAFFSTPSAFVGSFAMQLPIYALGWLGLTEMIGLFNRARQLISMPLTLLGKSISLVFQRRAAEYYTHSGNCRTLFLKTFAMLFGTSIIPMILLAIFAPTLFRIVLGPHWVDAGHVARLLIPMIMIRMVCNPLSTVFFVTGEQKEFFWLISATATLVAVAVYFASKNPHSGYAVVGAFSFAYTFSYVVFLFRAYVHSKGRPQAS